MAVMAPASGETSDERERLSRGRRWLGVLFPVVMLAIAVGIVGTGKVDVKPKKVVSNPACRSDDRLSDLVNRYPLRAATEQLIRWDACDTQLRKQAKDTLGPDRRLIIVIGAGLTWVVTILFRRSRWRTAGKVGLILAGTYVVADFVEDGLLHDVLTSGLADWRLPWVAAVKLGAALACFPFFLTAFLLKLSGSKTDHSAASNPFRHKDRSVVTRARRPGEATSPVGPGVELKRGDAGVACSGGGVRSAAFSLGALQALDEVDPTSGDPPPVSELARCRWLASVSGGSYMAAAWVSARRHAERWPQGTPAPWSRSSPEEDYLRRRSSYIAPGIGGKAWALVWFLLGLVLNMGLVVLALGVMMTPYGWFTDTLQKPASAQGVVTLPAGGCIRLSDGSWLVVRDGAQLQLDDDAVPAPAVGGEVVEPKEGGGDAKAKAEADGSPAIAVAVAGGALTTTTTTTPPASGPVSCQTTAGATPAGDVPPNADGRVFAKGPQTPVRASDGLVVHGRLVAGCPSPASVEPPSGACAPAGVQVFDVPGGSRVMAAPAARLKLDTAAIVADGGLLRACSGAQCEKVDRPWLVNAVLLALVLVFLTFGFAMIAVPANDAAHHDRREKFVRRLAVLSAFGVLLLLLLPWAVTWIEHGRYLLEERLHLASGASTGTIIVALLAQVRAGSGRSAEESKDGAPKALAKRVGGGLRKILVRLAAWVAGPVLLVAIALAFAAWGATEGFVPQQILWVLFMLGILLGIGSGADLNEWSLHPYYRDRLQSAYGMAVRDDNGQPDPTPQPLDDRLDHLGGTPELVLCATANIADPAITAPGRPAIPWTFTKDCIGSMEIQAVTGHGTYPPTDLGDRLNSIKTAVAVSGAAFSPGMGKMSRPERCLFAIGNLRLGVWYPNPTYFGTTNGGSRADGYSTGWYARHHPSPFYLAKEAFGIHRLTDRWIYVTDGGHYENLGLVELLRRGCREIYCFDASGDSPDTFGTLADAMRLAREELQVEIAMDPTPMKPDSSGISRMGVWAGTVTYPPDVPGERVGWFVLAKLAVPRTAPFDVVDLARTLPSFPNHPTADQLYTDQKFEAYRALGHHLGEEAARVGRAIRTLSSQSQPMSVSAAVAEVNRWLCARPDPAACPPEKPKSKDKDTAD